MDTQGLYSLVMHTEREATLLLPSDDMGVAKP